MKGLAMCILLTSSVVATSQQAPTSPALPVFGAEVENVYIDAFVSSGRVPLPGLKATDFELRDNGVGQSLELVAADSQPFLAVLAFDVSNSLEGEKMAALRAASQALLDSLRPEDEASLFTFADDVQWLAPPTTDKAAIRLALDRLRPSGGSPVIDALYASLILPRSRGRSLVVLFTDGLDNLSWLDWSQMQKVAERSNAVIHIVSLQAPEPPSTSSFAGDLRWRVLPATPQIAIESEASWALRQIAHATGGRTWEAKSPDHLKGAFLEIAEGMGKRYVLRYSPENVQRPGWHKIDLKLRGKKGDVRTRTGYWVPK